ncbi:hypothetical protein [Listeria seeligeri]|uniref:hypothetical protein n=1 Tax=Listeria seeligeri TaxID=1640 RepID=UPI001628E6B6|nr:hypothetical protein [Listeria seeligeri]MBC1775959.1 hypothetical protein [Listeria seeligeri]
MGDQRQRFKNAIKHKIQDFWNDNMIIIIYCSIVLFSIGVPTLITTMIDPNSNEEVKSQTQDYIEIQLGDDYQLAAWDYDYINCPLIPYALINVEVSYIGINNKTGKKKEVIEEDVSLSQIVEAIDKEKTKKRLEKQIKTAN